ncbi:phospholipid carrier-dependent glycosyltransferase [Candidatus Paracaedibacter symbiosus]|uniref:phospholipid carrier-dependent glycosyltransferase n=1 Tax=Candidatus Paracaedibacter symbiosus TaxID=244582 RepID=UPI000689A3E9|nr:glycosyltransferase family 39 protein [Candidatus Paracaedibacter symbiosus]
MRSTYKIILKDILFLSLIISLFFGMFLGTRPLSVPDEGRYTEIPREMVVSGDYVTPRLNGIKYFEKPPLMYWFEAASIKLFGVEEWALRFWPALLGLLTCLATYFVGSKLSSRRTGIFAALILASATLFNIISRLVILDVAVTCFLTTTLYSFLLATRAKTKKEETIYLALFFISSALSVLSKGLIGIVIPGVIIVLWALLTQQYRQILLAFKPWGILLFLAVAAPWHILVSMRNPEFAWFYFVHEHFLRYLTGVHDRTQPLWFFIPFIIFGWFPWTGHFLISLRDSVRDLWQNKTQGPNNLTFLLVWAGFIFTFFSISNSKLIPYITPAFPPLAILIGKTVADIWEGRRSDSVILNLSGVVSGLIMITFWIICYFKGMIKAPDFMPNFISLTIILSLFIVMIPLLRKFISVRAAIVGNFVLSLCFLMTVQFSWNKFDIRPAKDLIMKIASVKQPGDKIALIEYYMQDVAPYLNQKINVINYASGELMFGMEQEDTSSWMITFEDFFQQCQSGQIFYIILSADNFNFFAENELSEFKRIGEQNKYILVTNKK